ncbi:hypothetical protein [Deinococcus sp.]|uniref:hypothetical protein n=1 Tax=Deinococcus sp. TaxID=47478 RepID=UPI0025BFFBB0|nr:hypothetical protein [Deinococcus sp.]
MRRLLLACLLVLSSCAPSVLGARGWDFRALRTNAQVRLVDSKDFGFCSAKMVGCTAPLGQGCVIMLDQTYFLNGTPTQKTLLLAHEFGHCLDGSRLLYSHNHVGDSGKVYGPYYRPAVEGFAEAYARAYLKACGTNLALLGWETAPQDRGAACELPDPKAVRVQPEER